MNSYLDVAFHVIQQAQHRRLAGDLLPPAQLQLLYNKLKLQAKENGCTLHKNLNYTCLGSLYQQQFESVNQLCSLKMRKTEVVVHPMLNNCFLAFITNVQTPPIQCRTGTQPEIYLTRGINIFFVSP